VRVRSKTYLTIELSIAALLFLGLLSTDWAYQTNFLSKGVSMGFAAALLLLSSIAAIGLFVDVLVNSFHYLRSEFASG